MSRAGSIMPDQRPECPRELRASVTDVLKDRSKRNGVNTVGWNGLYG
jgi:hypothetical protein